MLFVWLLTCSSLNHQDIINPQILLLRTSSLSHTANHSSFSSSRSVPATALQGALVHFIGEWDLETRNQAVVCGHCCWGVIACSPLHGLDNISVHTYLCVHLCAPSHTCMCVLTHVHGCALAMYTLTSAHLSTHLHLQLFLCLAGYICVSTRLSSGV